MTKRRILLTVALGFLLFAQRIGSATNSATEIHAIVEVKESCLIGGVQNQKWVDADRFAKSLKTKQTFNLYKLEGPAGVITIDKIGRDSECGDEWTVEGPSTAKEGVAISSPSWEVMPRLPRAIDLKDTTYVNVVSEILKHAGIAKPIVNITQGYKIDLDGDGKDEVVIIASRFAQGVGELSGVSHPTSPGDYSLVLVRKIISNRVQNIFVVKDVWLKENEGTLPRAYHLSAIADLNGNGVMELILYNAYHEGSASHVIEINGTKASSVLECACEH